MTADDAGDVYEDVREWARRVRRTVTEPYRIAVRWWNRRAKLTQALLGVVVSVATFRGFGSVQSVMASPVVSGPVLTQNQLLLVTAGILIGQTSIQARTLNRLESSVRTEMESPNARTDGGRQSGTHTDGVETPQPTGGGAIGGAIVGGAVGSSYGIPGTVAGAILGAVFGNMVEA